MLGMGLELKDQEAVMQKGKIWLREFVKKNHERMKLSEYPSGSSQENINHINYFNNKLLL